MRPVKTVTLRGKRWRICYSPYEKYGECESPCEKNKLITLRDDLAGKDKLDTIIHEALHACLWDLDEEAVHGTAKGIATFLWRMGYRTKEDL